MEDMGKIVTALFLIMILAGVGVREYQRSLIAGHANSRFNLVLIKPEEDISLVSYDPVEKTITSWTFPAGTTIKSRKSGEYDVGSLYRLGSYDGEGGSFARQKIQGFLRVPVPAYLLVSSQSDNVKGNLWRGLGFGWGEMSNLSLLDRAILWMRMGYRFRQVESDELLRAGVMEERGGKVSYRFDRLQEYVGSQLFDWQMGGENITVAVLNASGNDGLGSDVADFLSNWGLDVVMVRTANNTIVEKSTWQIKEPKRERRLRYVFGSLLQMGDGKIEEVPSEYRAEILLTIGKDAEGLF